MSQIKCNEYQPEKLATDDVNDKFCDIIKDDIEVQTEPNCRSGQCSSPLHIAFSGIGVARLELGDLWGEILDSDWSRGGHVI